MRLRQAVHVCLGVWFQEGAVIIRKNDAAVTLFVIYSGEVTVESNDEEAAITLGPRQVRCRKQPHWRYQSLATNGTLTSLPYLLRFRS